MRVASAEITVLTCANYAMSERLTTVILEIYVARDVDRILSGKMKATWSYFVFVHARE